MSSLTLHLAVDDQATADIWTPIIASYLRGLADTVEAAPGAIEVAADWPDLEAWRRQPDGQLGAPVSLSQNTAVALWALLRREVPDPDDPLVRRVEDALRRSGWVPPPEPPGGAS